MLLRCLHCKEETSIDTATKRGKLWACDQCNKARRAILAEYTKKGQKHVRNKMSKDAKDVEIRKHKGKAPGRGKGFLSRYCCCLAMHLFWSLLEKGCCSCISKTRKARDVRAILELSLAMSLKIFGCFSDEKTIGLPQLAPLRHEMTIFSSKSILY